MQPKSLDEFSPRWQALRHWGEDAVLLESLIGGIANDIRSVRLDVPELDLVLPHNAASLDPESLDRATQASAAWEAAVCWDDDYSKSRLAEVRPV